MNDEYTTCMRDEIAQELFEDWLEERSGTMFSDGQLREVARYAIVAANIFVEELAAATETDVIAEASDE